MIRSRSSVRDNKDNLDRFIPNRSAMNFDFADYMLTEKKEKQNPALPSSQVYRKLLAEALNMNRTRIFEFRNKPHAVVDPFPKEFVPSNDYPAKPIKPRRYIPKWFQKIFEAPDIVDDFYLNLLDWGSRNVLAVALDTTVNFLDASNGSTWDLDTFDYEDGPITSLSWAPDGCAIAVGLNNSHVELWDSVTCQKVRTLRGGHRLRVDSLAWNDHILTTAGMDSKIINNDVRVRDHIVETYRGHHNEVCGLKWSPSGRHLASGGDDNLLFIWDRSMTSSNSATSWLHRLQSHTAAVKALSWCPFQANLLASGGGTDDRCIKFWNTQTGSCLNSVNTGSQVCSLLWSKHEQELVSSHGFPQNQLTLWKYPSMVKMATLAGHSSRVLYMAQSPDGNTVASAAADETLRLWNVFGDPKKTKPAPKKYSSEPFAHIAGSIR